MYVKRRDPWVSVKEASEIAQRSRYLILAAVADGTLVASRFGGRLCLLRKEVEALPRHEGSRSKAGAAA